MSEAPEKIPATERKYISANEALAERKSAHVDGVPCRKAYAGGSDDAAAKDRRALLAQFTAAALPNAMMLRTDMHVRTRGGPKGDTDISVLETAQLAVLIGRATLQAFERETADGA